MVNETRDMSYKAISPGTIGVSQRISMSYLSGEIGSKDGASGLVFLTENDVMPCGQNQY